MASNIHTSVTSAQAQATALAPLANSGYLDVYATPQPASTATAPGGSALATVALPASFSASVTGGVITAAAITAVNISVSGTALWFRVTKSDHATVLWDGSVGNGVSTAWVASTAYTVGQTVANGGNAYLCTTSGTSAGSGGPSGTGTSIADNTVVWSYIGLAIGDMTLNTAVLVALAQISISSLTYTVPSV